MEIKELIQKAHENAKSKGFWEDFNCLLFNYKYPDLEKETFNNMNNGISARLMLTVGEIGEAQEGLRKGDWNNFKEELADVAIRLADLCGGLGIDLETEIIKKMEKNKDRPYLHGKAF